MDGEMRYLTQNQARVLLAQATEASKAFRESSAHWEKAAEGYLGACKSLLGVVASLYDLLGVLGADDLYDEMDTAAAAKVARDQLAKLEEDR